MSAAATARLPLWRAAWVVARRDFLAILLSRAFLFFLLGPLFPLLVGGLAGGLGAEVQEQVQRPAIAVAMPAADTAAVLAAATRLAEPLGERLPPMRAAPAGEGPQALLAKKENNLGAVLTGTLDRPVLTGSAETIERWQGLVALTVRDARSGAARAAPGDVRLAPTASTASDTSRRQLLTAQGAQVLLFLLSMMLAGMVLSNLVEEKANKIIEILAAAIPMDAVFLGKLFAMLGVSLVGIAVWTACFGGIILLAGDALPPLAAPAVGWPAFVILFVAYFAMNYLLLGSLFLAIGSLASTVREVQTLSLPVTMAQLLVFFFAGYAIAQPGTPVELAAIGFPLSSPYAMLARAAQDPTLWIHLAALGWQALWVALFIRAGANLFRRRVMKSGPQRATATGGWRKRFAAKRVA